MKKLIIYIFLFFSIFRTAYPQQQNIPQHENNLKLLARGILKGNSDSIRISSNIHFLKKFENILSDNESYDYPFDSLKNISILKAPDNSFRIYTWILPAYNGSSYQYYGFLQFREKDNIKLFFLNDSTEKIRDPENAELTHNNWYGAVYYKILLNKHSGKKYYTLLGWKGRNRLSTIKLIEVLSFTDSEPLFGDALFKMNKKNKKRVIFEYNAQAVMSLRYVRKKNMIIYDHLSPPKPSLEGQYFTYGPDFTYEGLKFKKGKWIQYQNIDIRNN